MSQEVLATRPKQIYGEEELFGGFFGTLRHLLMSASILIMKSSYDEASVEKFWNANAGEWVFVYLFLYIKTGTLITLGVLR